MKSAFNLTAALEWSVEAGSTSLVRWLWKDAKDSAFHRKIDLMREAALSLDHDQQADRATRDKRDILKFAIKAYRDSGRARLRSGRLPAEKETDFFLPRLKSLEELHLILLEKSLRPHPASVRLEGLYQYQKNCPVIETPSVGAVVLQEAASCIEQIVVFNGLDHALFCARFFLTVHPNVDETMRAGLESAALAFCDRSGQPDKRSYFLHLRVS